MNVTNYFVAAIVLLQLISVLTDRSRIKYHLKKLNYDLVSIKYMYVASSLFSIFGFKVRFYEVHYINLKGEKIEKFIRMNLFKKIKLVNADDLIIKNKKQVATCFCFYVFILHKKYKDLLLRDLLSFLLLIPH